MSIFVDLVEFQKTIMFVLFFVYFFGYYPWELIFPLSHLSGWDVSGVAMPRPDHQYR